MRFAPALLLLASCASSSPAPANVTYANTIAALVKKQCFECHGPKSPTMEEFDKNKQAFKDKDLGPRYDTYEHLMVVVNGNDLGALMRRLDDGTNTATKKPGNMNEHLGETPEERAANLQLFKRWVGGWTLKRKNEVSEAERAAILAPRE
jgi:mono/diheme cytochrome c family protein